MHWDLNEAIDYYRRQGAPGDQNALKNLLAEVQAEQGGAIPQYVLPIIAEKLGVKETFLAAIIRRIPSLRMADRHMLEICGGPNCPKKANLSHFLDRAGGKLEIKLVPCMRMCGKGPNIRFDGKLYHGADAALVEKLLDEIK